MQLGEPYPEIVIEPVPEQVPEPQIVPREPEKVPA